MKRRWIIFIVLLLCVSNALALGIAYEYMSNNTITVPQGNERIFRLTLQNDQNIQISVNVVIDSEIAELRGKSNYTIPAKNYDTPVDIYIKVPDNATINSSYTVHYTITPTADKSTGQVPFSIRYDRSFNVIVGKPAKQDPLLPEPIIEQPATTTNAPEQKTTGIGITMLLIACIIAILGLVWRSSKKISNKITKSKSSAKEPIQKSAHGNTTATPDANVIADNETIQETIKEQVIASSNSSIAESAVHTLMQKEEVPANKIPDKYLDMQESEKIDRETFHNKSERDSRIPGLKAEIASTFAQQSTKKRTLQKATSEQRFFVANGPALEDLVQLQDSLEEMTDDQYSHHVHGNTNDFAAWTQNVFGMNELAQKMRLAKNRIDMIEVLENEL